MVTIAWLYISNSCSSIIHILLIPCYNYCTILDWVSETKVIVEGGIYVGFLRPDGSFTIRDVPAGSYIVEAISPNYLFEPVRVDISGRAKGKSRARKVNFLQNSAVVQVAYPLRFKAKTPAPFFEKRETWNIKDMLMNPMVSTLFPMIHYITITSITYGL